jgi:hypothetical protein
VVSQNSNHRPLCDGLRRPFFLFKCNVKGKQGGVYTSQVGQEKMGTRAELATSLEVVVKREVAAILVGDLLGRAGVGVLLLGAGHDAGLLVLADALLEEVGLASEGDVLHEVEGVGRLVLLARKRHRRLTGRPLPPN